jgi:CRISPR/Cas system-associated exonuclease Cas4 (RecB family)
MDYTPKRTRNLYVPFQEAPYTLSRSKVELFIECPCCFYVDRRLGTGRPPMYPFNLNLAVDHLLKKEFDIYRKKKEPHPMMEKYGSGILGFEHRDLDKWRENFQGIRHIHHDTNFILTGAVDDVWCRGDELIIVDYKATASDYKLTFKGERYARYRRQLDFYCYLFEKNDFSVAGEALFVACNGIRSRPSFEEKLMFELSIIKHKVDTSWVDETLFQIFEALQSDTPPASSSKCAYCAYSKAKASL